MRAQPRQRPSRSATWIPIAAVVVVIAAAMVLALALLGNHDGSGDTAAPEAPTRPAPTQSGASSGPGNPSASAQPAATAGPTATELVQAIDDYYSLVPGDLDAGWQRLTARYQADTGKGRASYDAYWHSIDRVTVSDEAATPPGSITVTLTYYFKDGHVTADRTEFGLVRQDGVLKIDSSQVLHSHAE
jgi:hypothetical protein